LDADRFVGTDVAGYSIESVLGRGGMGVVYLARQRSPNRRLALKLIAPGFSDDEAFRRRFLRESVAAAAIDHPHILPVYDAGESEGVLFIAMRLVEGEDLREILRSNGPLEPERALATIAQIGGALDAAHARGLVHRDVKPGNILVAGQTGADEPEFCYLTDFGVSAWTTSSAGTMTSADHLVGSVSYTAPEQIEGSPVGPGADLYSLGCVLYECLTGRAPFAGRSTAGILHAQLHEEPVAPSSLRPTLPHDIDAVLARCMSKDPDERYASCRELTHDLRAASSGGTPTPSGASERAPGLAPGHARNRPRARTLSVVAAAVVTSLIVAVTGLALADRNGGSGTPPTSGPTSVTRGPQLIRGVQATASSTAPSSVDGAGHLVTYLPGNAVDGKVETAWRTRGNGRGVTLTLLFDGPVDIVRIGLIPGYAKTDPTTGVNRFQQERTVAEVRYLIPSLPPTTKVFQPEAFVQFVNVSATASRITVKILRTTKPGGPRGNFTAISEIYVYGYPQ
jgi:serine/threonine protein kinase